METIIGFDTYDKGDHLELELYTASGGLVRYSISRERAIELTGELVFAVEGE